MELLKNVLDKINENGFEAYIVGGFVRDTLLDKNPTDVDIATNAREKDLMWIFKSAKGVKEYGAVKMSAGKYNIDITTFREESDLNNGRPNVVKYVNDLDTDVLRRDFTINALCFDSEFNLIDKVDGKKDLNNKLIKVIGNTKERFDEDPLRILRALRFMTVLDFNLSKDILSYLKNEGYNLSKINHEKRKKELDKIFASKNLYKFVSVVKKYKLEPFLGIKFNKVLRTGNSVGIWAQIEYDKEYNFTKQEKELIEKIKEIVSSKKIDKMTIYEYGNYVTLIASDILKKPSKRINQIYMSLPIKDKSEIDITSKEICDSLNITPSKELGSIYKELEKMIVYGKIENRKEIIISYLTKKGERNERFKRKLKK